MVINAIIGIVGVMLLFCIAIVVHEFGHFLAARLLGFRVETFSVGFGPAIWKKNVGGVVYKIGCIPLGGYVALPQLDPAGMAAIQGGAGQGAESLPPMPAWKRIVVAVAGPLGNVVLAVVVAFAIYAFAPASEFGGHGTVVGTVDPDAPVASSGIRTGDRLLSVNGQPVSSWTDFIVECYFSGNTNSGLPVAVLRDGNEVALVLPVVRDASSGYFRVEGLFPKTECRVADLMADMPAAASGLAVGDTVVSIAGREPCDPTDAVRLVREMGDRSFPIVVRRSGAKDPIEVEVAAVYSKEHDAMLIGAAFADPLDGMPMWMMHRQPLRQLSSDARSIFRILKALFAPTHKGESRRAAKDLGGPGTLLFMLWYEVQAGIFHALAFLRYLCINLAILNLLPIPVLDGGHVLFALYEIVARRRPSPNFVDIVTNAFAFLLIGLMALLLFRDACRIYKFTSRPAPEAASPADAPDEE